MTKKGKKSFIVWCNNDWRYHFKWTEHSARGFNHLSFPETRENELGFANTKVRITIEELK